MKELADDQVAALEDAFSSAVGDELVRMLSDLSMGLASAASQTARQRAEALGLVDASGATPLGLKVGDSCREFLMWEDRDRRLHEADRLPIMRSPTFEGRAVADLGCGFGCNLLSLHGVASEVVGVEIEPVYRQLSPLLARRAGLPPPRIIQAGADRTGLEDQSYDVVLNLGALQYMPIQAVLQETGRILRPGGTAVMILSHLGGFLRYAGTRMRTLRWRGRAREVVTIAGMLVYPWVGRAFTRPSDPVYPTQRRMFRWIEEAGLRPLRDQTQIIDHETCYVATKG